MSVEHTDKLLAGLPEEEEQGEFPVELASELADCCFCRWASSSTVYVLKLFHHNISSSIDK